MHCGWHLRNRDRATIDRGNIYGKTRNFPIHEGSILLFIDVIFRANALPFSTVLARFVCRLLTVHIGTHPILTIVAKRLRCSKLIPPGVVAHKGPHNHSLDKKVVHFCRERFGSLFRCRRHCSFSSHRCNHCGYYCTLPLGECRRYILAWQSRLTWRNRSPATRA